MSGTFENSPLPKEEHQKLLKQLLDDDFHSKTNQQQFLSWLKISKIMKRVKVILIRNLDLKTLYYKNNTNDQINIYFLKNANIYLN